MKGSVRQMLFPYDPILGQKVIFTDIVKLNPLECHRKTTNRFYQRYLVHRDRANYRSMKFKSRNIKR